MFNPFRTLNNVVTVADTHIEKFDETLDESFRDDGKEVMMFIGVKPLVIQAFC